MARRRRRTRTSTPRPKARPKPAAKPAAAPDLFRLPPNRIPLIHNYCDKWCQRCEFTSRCAVHAMELEDDARLGEASRDPANRQFWDRIGSSLGQALEMLRRRSIEMGIDPDEPPTPEYEAEQARIDKEVDGHELVRLAEDYRDRVFEWVKNSEPLLETKEKELQDRLRLELPTAGEAPADAAEIAEVLDVIQWYHTVIAVKVHRAVSGAIEGVPECIADMPRDSDGSAKVALISIERSMGAWMRLRAHLPEQRDAILDMLAGLERLLRGIERDFPDARAFVRPGFDEA